MKSIIIVFLSIFLFSCSKDPAVVPDYLDPIRFPIQIQPILKTFLSEGNKRGVYKDINNLKKIVLINYSPICNGVQSSGCYNANENIIYLDTTSFDWNISLQRRESLIFHELGHAILKRDHINNIFNSGGPESIMNCCLSADYTSPSILYKRDYYINELFNPNTTAPNWAY